MNKDLFRKCLIDFFIAEAIYGNNWSSRRFQKAFKEAKKQIIHHSKQMDHRVYERARTLLDGLTDLTYEYLIPKANLNLFLRYQIELHTYINNKQVTIDNKDLEEEFVNMITKYIENNHLYKNTSLVTSFLYRFKDYYIKNINNKAKCNYFSRMSSTRLAQIILYFCYKERKFINLKGLISLIYHINLEHFSLWGEWLINEPFYKDDEYGFIYTKKIRDAIEDFELKIMSTKNVLEYYYVINKEYEKEYELFYNYEFKSDLFTIRSISEHIEYHTCLNMRHLKAFEEVNDGDIVTNKIMVLDINPTFYRRSKRLYYI